MPAPKQKHVSTLVSRETCKFARSGTGSAMGWGDREARSGYRRGASPYGLGFATAAAICKELPPLSHLRCLEVHSLSFSRTYSTRRSNGTPPVPLPIKDRDRVSGEETGETRLLFKTVFVFDRSQVAPLPTGTPTPLEPPCEPLTGESHARLIAPLVAFAESLGYAVSFESIAGAAGGWCDASAKRIVVDADAPGNARLRTLVHEVAHALGVGYAEYGRARAEVIVDTVTYLACASAGLDVSGESIPYVAGWGEDGA